MKKHICIVFQGIFNTIAWNLHSKWQHKSEGWFNRIGKLNKKENEIKKEAIFASQHYVNLFQIFLPSLLLLWIILLIEGYKLFKLLFSLTTTGRPACGLIKGVTRQKDYWNKLPWLIYLIQHTNILSFFCVFNLFYLLNVPWYSWIFLTTSTIIHL